jgi:glycosyltransferase involved in cell wall biosynthesis
LKRLFNTRYIPFTGLKLGGLRNVSNREAKGDIIVCMDDDDFYFPDRIEHCVDKLTHSDCLIAGCNDILIYDYILKRYFSVHLNTLGKHHSTNNALAYKREYLKNHCYDYNKDIGEETLFLNNFTEPIVQLDTYKTLILSSHGMNTFNKRELLTNGLLKYEVLLNGSGIPDTYRPMPLGTNLIPKPLFDRYCKLFVKEEPSPYDIVYFAGSFSIEWDPVDKRLGGSEQAIVELSKAWTNQGKKVAVYGNIRNTGTFDNVDYKNWKEFPYHHTFKCLIVWRLMGLCLVVPPFHIKADRIILDLHDNLSTSPEFIYVYSKHKDIFSEVYFKSEYHKNELEKALKAPIKSYKIIPNGIRVKDFLDKTRGNNGLVIKKNPYRFCYTACYTRGLVDILEKIWPVIFKLEPKAEFHVYYGMDHVSDATLKEKLNKLLSQPGVMDHGRQPMDIIIREKYMSSFQLYLSLTNAEIDCINIRESLITGCIPILSDFGIFKTRDGLHYKEYNPNNIPVCNAIAIDIVNKMKNEDFLDETRAALKKSNTIISWEKIAELWF